MENLLDKLMEMGLGYYIDESHERLIREDTTYKDTMEAVGKYDEIYANLDISKEQRRIIDKYMEKMSVSESRFADISYMAGIRDTVTILKYLGFLDVKGEF